MSFPTLLLIMFLISTSSSSIVNGLLFVRSGPFVALSRFNPDGLCAVDSRICFVGTRKTVACIIVGFASGSNILSSAERDSRNTDKGPTRTHQVTLTPFAQMFRHEMSVLGKVLGFNTITGSILREGISFTTRPEREPSSVVNNANTSSSPGMLL